MKIINYCAALGFSFFLHSIFHIFAMFVCMYMCADFLFVQFCPLNFFIVQSDACFANFNSIKIIFTNWKFSSFLFFSKFDFFSLIAYHIHAYISQAKTELKLAFICYRLKYAVSQPNEKRYLSKWMCSSFNFVDVFSHSLFIIFIHFF